MKKLTLVIFALILCDTAAYNQAGLEVEGSIQIGGAENSAPEPGTIRWTGLNFEGWNGVTWMSLTSFKVTSIIMDVDSNKYHTVTIGDREWMAENLRTTRYVDGVEIPGINNDSTVLETPAAWWWYDNDSTYEVSYGKLYNWYTGASGKLCPKGWRVPTDEEWTMLIDYLDPGDVLPVEGIQSMVAGGKMKETGLAHWNSPNKEATNEIGLTALPGGFRNSSNGLFSSLGYGSYWWSTTEAGGNAWYRLLSYSSGNIARFNGNKSSGFSVRCLRN